MIKRWQKFIENLELDKKEELKDNPYFDSDGNPIIKKRDKVLQNKLMVSDLLGKLEDPFDPEFKERFTQHDTFVAKNFIETGHPSEWYLMEIIDYLQSKGVEVPDEIWK
jgi:hypothetical protein